MLNPQSPTCDTLLISLDMDDVSRFWESMSTRLATVKAKLMSRICVSKPKSANSGAPVMKAATTEATSCDSTASWELVAVPDALRRMPPELSAHGAEVPGWLT